MPCIPKAGAPFGTPADNPNQPSPFQYNGSSKRHRQPCSRGILIQSGLMLVLLGGKAGYLANNLLQTRIGRLWASASFRIRLDTSNDRLELNRAEPVRTEADTSMATDPFKINSENPLTVCTKTASQKPPQEILYRILGFQAEFLAKPVTGFLDAVRLQ